MSAPNSAGGYSTKYTIGSWSAVNNGQPFVDSDGCWWKVTTEIGWSGSPAPRSAPVDREQSDGAFDGPAWLPGRTITLAGTVMAGDQLTLHRKIDQINALLNAGSRVQALVVAEAHLTRQAMVRRTDQTLAAKWTPFLATWQLVLYSFDPNRYSAVLNHVTGGLYSGANGRPYPLVYPKVYGALGNQGLVSAHNAGNLDAYPTLTLTAAVGVPLLNPQVRLVGGALIRAAMTVDPGSFLVFDMQNEVVLLNGVADRTTALTSDSSFFPLPAGSDSQLLFTADSGLGASMDAAWRDTYA